MAMNLGTAIGYLELNTDRWSRGFQTAQSQMRTLADSSQSMGTRFSAAGKLMQGVGSTMSKYVTLPLVGVGTAAVKMSIDTENSMAKVNSILQLNKTHVGGAKSEWDKYSDTLKRGANDIKLSYSDYSNAAYDAISAGVKQTEVVNFLDRANKLAKGGMTDLTSATNLLTTVQNAYGLSQKDMAHVSDVLIQTQNKGKVTVDELAASMGKVIPTAKGQGVSVEQLGASYAIMTSKGIAAAESTTYINSMFNELGKSGTKVDKALKEVSGKSFKELMESGKSVGDVLQILKDHAEKSGLSLSDLFGSAEAGKAALTLLSDGADGFNKQLDGMANSTGLCDKAFNEMNNTTKEKLAQSFASLKNALSDVGEAIQPLVSKIAELITSFANWVSNLAQTNPKLMQMIVVIGGVVAAIGPLLLVFGSILLVIPQMVAGWGMLRTGFLLAKTLILDSLIPALGSLFTMMLANPITLVIAAVAALAAGFVYLWNNCDGFREFWINLWNTVTEWCKQAVDKIVQFFSDLPSNLASIWENVKTTILNACKSIGDFFTKTIPQWISNIGKWFSELPEKIGFALGYALGSIIKWGADTWNYLATNVPKWIQGIVKFFSELPGKIWTWLVNTFNKVTQWGSQMLQKAKETGSKFMQNIITFIQQLPGKIWSFLTQAIQKAIQFATQFAQKGTEAARKFGTNIVNGVKNIPNQVVSIGKNIVQGLWRGISGAAGWLANKVKSFAKGILNGMKSALGIHSPSRVMRDIVGKNIVLGIGKGIEQEENTLLRTANAMTSKLTDAMVINPRLVSEANSLNSSSNLATNATDSARGIGNVVINLQNVNLSDKLDIESLATELAFYINRKSVF